jgi:hypothetical protein
MSAHVIRTSSEFVVMGRDEDDRRGDDKDPRDSHGG